MSAAQGQLFGPAAQLPEGFVYVEDFIGEDVERALLEAIGELPLEEAKYKSYTARRRIAAFGSSYDFDANVLGAAPVIPAFLLPLREKVALKAGLPGETQEFADMYTGMARQARAEGFEEIADWFETLAKAERSHANRFQKALDAPAD